MIGIKVSKTNKDVKKVKNQDLIFDTDSNMFKFYRQGVIKLVMPAYSWPDTSIVNFSIKHDLGYLPSYFLFIKGKTERWGQLEIQAQSVNWSPEFPYVGKCYLTPNYVNGIINFNNYPDTGVDYPEHELLLHYIVTYEVADE